MDWNSRTPSRLSGNSCKPGSKILAAGAAAATAAGFGAAAGRETDGLVRGFAAGRHMSHAPPTHSRHANSQIQTRKRITLSQ